MSHIFASRWRLLDLTVRSIFRNLECWYLARIANRQDDYLLCLVNCIGYEFFSAEPSISGVGYHTQSRPGYALNSDNERTSEICWEAPVCITVYCNGQPLVGMAVELYGSVLSIRQLQGAPGVTIPKTLQKWPALFVYGAKNFLFNTKEIVSLRLYDADQRPSYKYPVTNFSDEEMKLYRRNLRRRYDGTARQQGFKKRHRRFWEWNLSMLPEQSLEK